MQNSPITADVVNHIKGLEKRLSIVENKKTGTIIVDEQIIAIDPDTGVKTIIGDLTDSGGVGHGLQQWVGDVEPPPVPSAPMVSCQLSIFTFVWNGLNENLLPQAPDFSHLNIYGTNGTTTLLVGVIKTSQETALYPDAQSGETWTFWFTSVDFNGNESAASELSEPMLVVPTVADPDIAGAIQEFEQGIAYAQQVAASADNNAASAWATAKSATAAAQAATAQSASAWTVAAQASAIAVSATARAASADANAASAWTAAKSATAVAASAETKAASAITAANAANSVAASANSVAASAWATSVSVTAQVAAATAQSSSAWTVASAASAIAVQATARAASADANANTANANAAAATAQASSAWTAAAAATAQSSSAVNTAAAANAAAASALNTAIIASNNADAANTQAASANSVAGSARTAAQAATAQAGSALTAAAAATAQAGVADANAKTATAVSASAIAAAQAATAQSASAWTVASAASANAVTATAVAAASDAKAASAVTAAQSATAVAGSADSKAASAITVANAANVAATAATQTANTADTNAKAATAQAASANSVAGSAMSAANSATAVSASAIAAAQAATGTALAASNSATAAVATSKTATAQAASAIAAAQSATAQAGSAITVANTATTTAQSATAQAASANTTAVSALASAATAQKAADDAMANANKVRAEALSRGNDLVTNGSGTLGDNTNFPSFPFVKGDQPTGTSGSFEVLSAGWSTEKMVVDVNRKYAASVWARQVTPGVTSKFYLAIAPYDADGLLIATTQYMEQVNTRTTLTADLKPGDTVMSLASSANWKLTAGVNSHLRNVIFWNYVDGSGKLWGPGTYSRNTISNAYEDGGISGNIVNLRVPYTGVLVPAGTPVGNGAAGGNYMYPVALASVSNEWTKFDGATLLGGVHTNLALSATTMFPIPTASVVIGVLPNYNVSGGTSVQRFTGFSFSDITANVQLVLEADAKAASAQSTANQAVLSATAAASAAGAAQSTANGKNTIWFTTTTPPGTPVTGDTWYNPNEGYAMRRFNGTWQVSQFDTAAFAAASITANLLASESVVAGKIAAGAVSASSIVAQTIDATHIKANAITASALSAQSITATALAAQSITATAIKANAITATALAAGSITATAIASQTITATALAADSITASAIKSGSIAASHIVSASIDATHIKSGAITATAIAAQSITATALSAQSITATAIAALSITATAIAGNSITATAIKAGSISASHLTADSITATAIKAGAITASAIAANAITATALAANSITATALAALSITATAIAGNSITATAIKAGSITASHLVADSITATAIKAGSITASHIVTNAITADELAATSVTASHIRAGVIDATHIKANSITATALAAQSITATAIKANSITATALAAGSITATALAANSITATAIAAQSITATAIKAQSITATALAADSITATAIAADQISASHIVANAITASHIAAGTITANKLLVGNGPNMIPWNPQVTTEPHSGWNNTILNRGNDTDIGWYLSATQGDMADNTWLTSMWIQSGVYGNNTLSGSFDVVAGESYRFKIGGAAGGNYVSGTPYIRFLVYIYDSVGTFMTSTTSPSKLLLFTGVFVDHLVTMPAGASSVRIYMQQNDPGAVLVYSPSMVLASDGSLIVDGAVTAKSIAASAVDATHIAANAITATAIAALSITATALAANSITATAIKAEQITASHIVTNAITASHIKSGSIGASHIVSNAITADELAATSITASHIRAGVVDATHIKSQTITATALAAQSITATAIKADAITATAIAASAIDATHIKADAITATAIAAKAIDATHIKADAITATAIKADQIAASHIVANAITASHIKSLSITASHIVSNAITATELAATSVTASHIRALAINATHIRADAITATAIAADQITASHIVAAAITASHIKSKSISVDNLLIGSTDNVIADPEFTNNNKEWTTTPNSTYSFPTTEGIDGNSALKINAVGVQAGLYGQFIPVSNSSGAAIIDATTQTPEELENFRVSVWVKSSKAVTAGAQIALYARAYPQGGGTIVTSTINTRVTEDRVTGARTSVAGNAALTANNWSLLSGVFKVPAGTGKILLGFYVQSSYGTGTVWFSNAAAYRMGDGNLILDGSITGDHIHVNTLDAVHIKANAITADKIVAGSIDVSKLTIGSSDNLIADPQFFDTALTDKRNAESNATVDAGWYKQVTYIRSRTGLGNGNYTYRLRNSTTGSLYDDIAVIPGRTYRVRYEVFRSATGSGTTRTALYTKSTTGVTSFIGDGGTAETLVSGWKYYEREYTVPADVYSLSLAVQILSYVYEATAYVAFRNISMTAMSDGQLIVNGAIDGKSITGALIKTNATANRGVEINGLLSNNFIRAYNSSGVVTFDVNGNTGDTLITGTFQTATSGRRAKISDRDTQAALDLWSDTTGAHASLFAYKGTVYNTSLRHYTDAVNWSYEYALTDNGFYINRYNAPSYFRGLGDSLYSDTMFAREYTASGNVVITSNGILGRSTSKRANKLAIDPLPESYDDKILSLSAHTWYDRRESEDVAELYHLEYQGEPVLDESGNEIVPTPDKLRRVPGMIAEEVADAGLTEFVTYGQDGSIEGLMYERLGVSLIPIVGRLRNRIVELERKVDLLLA